LKEIKGKIQILTSILDCTPKVKLREEAAMQFQLKVNISDESKWEFAVKVIVKKYEVYDVCHYD